VRKYGAPRVLPPFPEDLTFSRGARLITGPAATDFNFNTEMASQEGGRIYQGTTQTTPQR